MFARILLATSAGPSSAPAERWARHIAGLAGAPVSTIDIERTDAESLEESDLLVLQPSDAGARKIAMQLRRMPSPTLWICSGQAAEPGDVRSLLVALHGADHADPVIDPATLLASLFEADMWLMHTSPPGHRGDRDGTAILEAAKRVRAGIIAIASDDPAALTSELAQSAGVPILLYQPDN